MLSWANEDIVYNRAILGEKVFSGEDNTRESKNGKNDYLALLDL